MKPLAKARDGSDAVFWLRVNPRASRERLSVDAAGGLRLDVHAPATDGRANEACIEFLAKAAGVARSRVEIVAGEKSRRKLIRIRADADAGERVRAAAGQGKL